MSRFLARKVAVAGIVLASLALVPQRAAAAAVPTLDVGISMDSLWSAACGTYAWLRTQWSPRPIPDPNHSRGGTPPPKTAAGLSNDGHSATKLTPRVQ